MMISLKNVFVSGRSRSTKDTHTNTRRVFMEHFPSLNIEYIDTLSTVSVINNTNKHPIQQQEK